ncbi:MAG: hypothetical protein K0Q60_3619 [Microvirga sp.]|jgi:hypothetical protein|nr:hypothetical protein [Microvirga sp.]
MTPLVRVFRTAFSAHYIEHSSCMFAGLATWNCRAIPPYADLQALPQAPHLWRGRCNG